MAGEPLRRRGGRQGQEEQRAERRETPRQIAPPAASAGAGWAAARR